MLILTLELEVKIIVGLSSFVLSLNPTFSELYILTAEGPPLAVLFIVKGL